MKVFIYSADNKFGVIVAKEFLYGQHKANQVICGVYSIRSESSLRLLEMGARVVELTMEDPSSIVHAMQQADTSVILPAIHYGPNWHRATLNAIHALEQAHQSKAVLMSSLLIEAAQEEQGTKAYGGHEHQGYLKKWIELESEFSKVAEQHQKGFYILRCTVPQQLFLFYSRLIQETGTLMLPIGKGKCAYVDIHDIAKTSSACLASSSSFSSGQKGACILRLTGPEAIDGETLIKYLNSASSSASASNFSFKDIDPKLAARYLLSEAGDAIPYECVQAVLYTYDMIKRNKLSKVYEDVKKVTGEEPRPVQIMLKQYVDLFRP